MNITLSPKAVLKFLLSVVAILLVANLVVIAIYAIFDSTRGGWLPELFILDGERNIPTFYSAISLMLSALLLFLIAIRHRKSGSQWGPWLGLSLIMCFLSIDETVLIHEQLVEPTRKLFNISDAFYYAWIIPYILIAAIVFLSYFKFLMRLPKRTRFLFLLSGGIFILGAAGFEAGGNVVRLVYPRVYNISTTIEELLEMVGVVYFIYALLDYIDIKFNGLDITIAAQPPRYYPRIPQKIVPRDIVAQDISSNRL